MESQQLALHTALKAAKGETDGGSTPSLSALRWRQQLPAASRTALLALLPLLGAEDGLPGCRDALLSIQFHVMTRGKRRRKRGPRSSGRHSAQYRRCDREHQGPKSLVIDSQLNMVLWSSGYLVALSLQRTRVRIPPGSLGRIRMARKWVVIPRGDAERVRFPYDPLDNALVVLLH
jgi:hypothetical protein